MLRSVAPYTARQFARAIVMPNLVPPITTVEAAAEYRDRIGNMTVAKTVPQILDFLNAGGTVLAIGSATDLAQHLHLPG